LTEIGTGIVEVHTTHVHGVSLNDDEMKIKILTVLGEVQHPEYSYRGTQQGRLHIPHTIPQLILSVTLLFELCARARYRPLKCVRSVFEPTAFSISFQFMKYGCLFLVGMFYILLL